jgi:DNA-binding Lrp family transcriptional regulator
MFIGDLTWFMKKILMKLQNDSKIPRKNICDESKILPQEKVFRNVQKLKI